VPTIGFTVLFVILLPNTKTIANSLLEIALIVTSVTPNVLPIALRKPVDVLTVVAITVGKLFVSLTMLQPVLEASMTDIT
jgi:hypothetical protein